MSEMDPIGTEKDRALWARLKAGAPANDEARLPPVADEDLTAWLDGRLPPDAAAQVEARLAADSRMLTLALDVTGALREAATPAPDRLVTRAQALAGFEAERPARAAGGLSAWFARWRRGFEIAAVAGAFLVVCVTGFSLGGGFQEAYANGNSVEITDFVTATLGDSDISFMVEQGSQP
ncbi:MAG TPA: hypothetical protein VJR58_22085 [Vineibacter sp.]|nr:hypothetical protein [Vineibacter sp.]